MRYTVNSGLERSVTDKLRSNNLALVLPLIAVLIFVAIFGFKNQKPTPVRKPVTLGIYTIKSATVGSTTKPASSGNDSNNNSPSSTTSDVPSQPSITQFSGTSASSPASNPSIASSGGGGSSSTPPAGGVGGGSGTVGIPCTDITGISFTCTQQACTPAVALTPGQKALLTVDGTCVIVN